MNDIITVAVLSKKLSIMYIATCIMIVNYGKTDLFTVQSIVIPNNCIVDDMSIPYIGTYSKLISK